jgi:hypothetical protein
MIENILIDNTAVVKQLKLFGWPKFLLMERNHPWLPLTDYSPPLLNRQQPFRPPKLFRRGPVAKKHTL